MPTYRVTDPQSGRTLRLTGDSPPTEQELNDIFAPSGGGIQDTPIFQAIKQRTENEVPQWGINNPNLYGLYGAGRALLRTGIEAGTTAAGAAGGAMIPAPGTSLIGAGLGYATGKRVADVVLNEPSDASLAGRFGDIALGSAMQGAGNIVSKGIMRSVPQSTIDKLYASSLKLPTSPQKMSIGEREAVIKTGLNESGVPNVETGIVGKAFGFKGYNQVVDKIDTFGRKINSMIDGATRNNKTISSQEVAKRLDDLLAKGDRLSKADPNFKGAIQKVKDEFLAGSDEITAKNAQEMKVHIYKVYQNYYGIDDATAAYVQGKKAIARGLKEEIETIHPDIKNLNMKESELLEFLDPLGQATGRIQNRDIIGIGMQMSPMTAAALAGGSGAAGKIGFLAKIIDTPSVKARLAILLHRAKTAGTGSVRQAMGAATPTGIIGLKNREEE